MPHSSPETPLPPPPKRQSPHANSELVLSSEPASRAWASSATAGDESFPHSHRNQSCSLHCCLVNTEAPVCKLYRVFFCYFFSLKG